MADKKFSFTGGSRQYANVYVVLGCLVFGWSFLLYRYPEADPVSIFAVFSASVIALAGINGALDKWRDIKSPSSQKFAELEILEKKTELIENKGAEVVAQAEGK